MTPRLIQSLVVAGGLAIAIHLDWHVARHGDRLSLGWSYHWILAIPVFAAAAVHTVRAWPDRVMLASVGVLTGGVVLGQVVEPVLEVVLLDGSVRGGFGADRLAAFAAFVGTGIGAFAAVAWKASRARRSRP